MPSSLRASLTDIQAASDRDEVLRSMVRGTGDCLTVARLYTVKNGALRARLHAVNGVVEDEQVDDGTFRPDRLSVIGRVVEHGGLYVGPLPNGDITRLALPPGISSEHDTAIAAVRIRRRTVAVLVGQPVGDATDVRGQLRALVSGAAASLASLIVRTRDPELEALRLANTPDELLEALVHALSKHVSRSHGFVVRDGALHGRYAFVDGQLDASKVRGKHLRLNAASVAARAVQDGLVLIGPCPTDDPILDLLSQPVGKEDHLGLVPIAVRRRTVCLVAGCVSPDQSDRVAPFLRRVQKQGSEAFALLILKSKGEEGSSSSAQDLDEGSMDRVESRASNAGRSLAVVGVVLVFIVLVAFWYGLFFDKNPARELFRLVPSRGGLAPQGPSISSAVARAAAASRRGESSSGPRESHAGERETTEGADRCCVRAC